MPGNSNGNGWKTWLIGALFTVLMLTVGLVNASTLRATDAQQKRIEALEATADANRERIVAVEQQLIAVRDQLNRIEGLGNENKQLLLQHMKLR